MKKTLQQIAFGLSIIVASVGATQAMQAEATVSDVAIDPVTQSIMKITRSLNQSAVPAPEFDFMGNGVDLNQVRVMDGESIIRGTLPPKQQDSFLEMLHNPITAMTKFNTFLDNDSDFCPDPKQNWINKHLSDITSFAGISLSHMAIPAVSNIMYTICEKTIDEILGCENPVIDPLLEKKYDSISMQLIRQIEELSSPSIKKYIELHYKTGCDYSKERYAYKEKLRSAVEQGLNNPVFREGIVSFLIAFESEKNKNPNLRMIFAGEKNHFSVQIKYSGDPIINLYLNDDNYIYDAYTVPNIFGSSGKTAFVKGYEYAILHEFGHVTDALLKQDVLVDRKGFVLLSGLNDKDIPKFAKDLLFGDWVTLQNCQSVTLDYHSLWTSAAEVLQITGLSFYKGMIIVNKLSDFNYSVSQNVPFRWWHYYDSTNQGPVSTKQNIYKYLIQAFMYLHEENYEEYVSSTKTMQVDEI